MHNYQGSNIFYYYYYYFGFITVIIKHADFMEVTKFGYFWGFFLLLLHFCDFYRCAVHCQYISGCIWTEVWRYCSVASNSSFKCLFHTCHYFYCFLIYLYHLNYYGCFFFITLNTFTWHWLFGLISLFQKPTAKRNWIQILTGK